MPSHDLDLGEPGACRLNRRGHEWVRPERKDLAANKLTCKARFDRPTSNKKAANTGANSIFLLPVDTSNY